MEKYNTSQPYFIIVTNNSVNTEKVVLFGWDRNWNKPNFGNSKHITFNGFEKGNYSQLLAQSATQPFKIGKWRVDVVNGTGKFPPHVTVESADANGSKYTTPVLLLKDAYQTQCNIVDINKTYVVSGSVSFHFDIAPKQTVCLTLFPSSKISLAASLNAFVDGIKSVFSIINYSQERIGQEQAPVIIQTSPNFVETDLKIDVQSTTSKDYMAPLKPVKLTWWRRLWLSVFKSKQYLIAK